MGRPAFAVAFLYSDNSVAVLRGEDQDEAQPGFLSRLEFTIPTVAGEVNGEMAVEESPWPNVVALGTKQIRERIGILPDGRWGSRGTCRTCGEPVVFVTNQRTGKTPPYDLSGLSHFESCRDADYWRRSERPV